ncbi:nucleoside hydrolase [Devosia sp. Root413D1]|uniref:nucleoside hydrolase n=1 Tax=Devosia sp. Root413D1 TaxID=1736531 RepID=UPI0006FC8A0D|nr:nucleoside hydrolase [Devosia sp. Root413D1]KQW80642.1 nucleoside hydrolase [Devosia sp. Root413D1]
MQTLKVIYDTDPGVDDAMALLLLARHKRIELIGVTTVFGNADIATTTRNALYLKQKLGFSAPVAGGAGAPLVGEPDAPPTFVHGMNGLGDIDLPDITAAADPRPAHQLIIDLVKADPGEVTIIAVGRMTNLERAMREAPEIVGLVRQIVVMGGAFGRNGHTGNVTPVAEANIWGDPDAADIVFGAAWPIAIAGLDVTQATVMTETYVAELAAAGEDGAFVRAISAFYQNFHRESAGLDGFYVHDSSAVALALHPEFYQMETGAIRVVTEGIAIGQTIIKPDGRNYPPGAWDGRPSQRIAVGVNAGAVLKFYRDTLVGSG